MVRGDIEVHGSTRRASFEDFDPKAHWHTADFASRTRVSQLLADVQPDWIIHLAGYAHAGRSFQERDAAWAGNLDGTRNLYEAIAASGRSPRVLYVSTGLVYGDVDGACDESTPFRPASPYAASKAAADVAGLQYARHPGLGIVVARPFNHVGPRQSPDYAVARFASQIAAIERGEQGPILETGDLNAERDLTDVRDVVRAYVALMEHGKSGEAYNVAGGATRRIGDVLAQLLALSPIAIQVQTRLGDRPPERSALRVDTAKLQRDTGWRPQLPFDKTLEDTLDYWRRARKDLAP